MNVADARQTRLIAGSFKPNGVQAEDSQRVCVITGAGIRGFCAGGDLKGSGGMGAGGQAGALALSPSPTFTFQ